MSTVGPDSVIERVLSEYGIGADSWHEDLLESDTDRLLLALLLDQRGDQYLGETSTSDEPTYFVTEVPVAVDGVGQQSLDWGFPADTVTVWGFDGPVLVSFQQTGTNREIPLTASEAPFSLSPPGGLNASKLWYRKMTESDADTTLKVLALR
ncbi:hypothetical protein GBQ70_11710 [Halomicrobium sp. ZPS1]|uniref:Uncharacterized protein n=2 Tax=Halomicrobium mukohataei TaxID=57705 RepID=C7P409_HALMD|nr:MULTISPECIES: hypothetical protein [Halomicrobium]ACV47831.1 hypothetical protein Hmuk_1717 [Halomicrobium mukohataei DSM 12286]QCD66277.1 hypothetical protein E5139_11715 [Halomicrobium mukohataei]QFR21083.1 hypothetical protein GBQ70_11710 [Halomicrobium sp. ZPS1]